MSRTPALTFVDRAQRHKRIVAAYESGASSRAVADWFGMNDSHVRYVLRLYGVARRPGRPSNSKGLAVAQ
jgi:hypothetical protein